MAELRDRLQAALGEAYQIERELGGGGMSRVFVALETKLARRVVIKVLPPEMAAGVSADRFEREIQLAASLQHPHIVPLLHSGRADDLVWYTMPLIEGESLRAKLARDGELPITEAVRILRDVADALGYAHAHGVVHRDIKPDNVLLSARHAVVTDFGVAKALSDATGPVSLTSVGVALGTPAYMAPEQAAAEHVDHRADIYSLGALAYEVLTGRPPFTGTNAQQVLAAHVTQAPDPLAKHRAAVPPALAAIVLRCLEKKPADRWQQATDIHAQLEGMTTPSGGMVPTTATIAVKRPRTVKVAAIAAGVLAIAAALFTVFSRGGSRVDPNVVAVLPFRVAGADPALHYLREGMIDLLAAKLTGEGGPRAADPRTVTSAFHRAAGDQATDLSQERAVRVASGIGAGQALLGGIVGSPAHITMSATVVSVPGGATRAQATVEGPADSLPVLVDRLAAQLLIRGASVGAQGEASLNTRSLPALQLYLEAQHEYRRGSYENAAAHFSRALELDSTFSAAAFWLVVTNGWGTSVPTTRRLREIAWAGRERFSPRDRMMIEALFGSRWPEPATRLELIQARERLVSAVPDNADAWYFLADMYFHQGKYVGIEDWYERSQGGFERAIALDSNFAGPLSHMVTLAAERGDTAMARRFGALYVRNEETRGSRFDSYVRWDLARALGDQAMMRRVWAAWDSAPAAALGIVPILLNYGADQPTIDTALAVGARHASTQDQRIGRLRMRSLVEMNRGRPAAAGAALDSARQLMGDGPEVWFAEITTMAWGPGDTARGYAAMRRLAALAEGPPPEGPQRNQPLSALCYVETQRIARGEYGSVARTLARVRSAEPGVGFFLELCPPMLDALLATAQRRPDALRLVERIDSIMRQGFDGPSDLNLLVAGMFETLGEPARALAAVRRGGFNSFADQVAAYAIAEGRLAAATGDREGAIRAYERYLSLRANPEPSVKPIVDGVRAELAKLVGETGDR